MKGEIREKDEQRRKSKDKKLNREGRILVAFIEERGWYIYNEVIRGDEEEEYTFRERERERGNTVIDYN